VTCARLRISDGLAAGVRLPPGFREIWCRSTECPDTTEWLIEGPFDPAVEDGALVALVTWPDRYQWFAAGKPVGPPIEFEAVVP
jgi:hypothetical protein